MFPFIFSVFLFEFLSRLVDAQSVSTGVVRDYSFTVARGLIAPDGFNKTALLVNGQFPGPTIEANHGDTFNVTVYNNITGPEEGTAIHWHGIHQTGTPYWDGVAAITQCPIAPGKSMTYTFLADSYGSSFWHAHYGGQYIDGVFGAMIVNGPSSAAYDIDLGAVFLTDYFHNTYYQNAALIESVPLQPPFSDNNLINGKNYQACAYGSPPGCSAASSASTFHFEMGKLHKLRLINAGAEGLQRFSIDNHTLQVVANDMVPIVPYKTNVVPLGVGSRVDVIVKASGSASDAVWMRSDISTFCAFSHQPHALAAIYYPEANDSTVPATAGYFINDTTCTNDPISWSVPYEAKTPPSVKSATVVDTTLSPNATNHTLFWMNNSSFFGDYNNPILLDLANESSAATLLSPSPPPELNIYNYHNETSIRLMLVNPNGASHPMHLHGHEFYILAEGFGTWDGNITNPENPVRKDVHLLSGGTVDQPAFMLIEFELDNPGAWAFHCHIAWHLSLGMIINVLDHPLELQSMQFPADAAQTCKDWNAWTATNFVDQGDAGP